MENNEKINHLRHSAAHVLAQAVLELYPGTLPTIGPVTPTGFFYDFLPVNNFKEEDLPIIEQKMREIVHKNYPITGKQVSKEEARAFYSRNRFKLELIDGIEAATVGLYSQGSFTDLCRGGHTATTGDVLYFKLTSISGSYWRADRNGIPLQRITGIAFQTQQEMDEYLQRMEDAKIYDHRRLGKQMDLFSFRDEAPGMAFYHPKGTVVYNALIDYSRKLQKVAGYLEIKTPLIMNESLWKTSGHYDNYRENMFFTSIEETTYCVRPMNCPSSILVYKERPHSYRELPLRLAEYGMVHRYELSGTLHGLFRVRSFTQDDAHIYCMPNQIEEEVVRIFELTKKVYGRFGFQMTVAISTRPEKSIGSDELWESATNALKNALTKHAVPFTIQEGEGAFYGPKVDISIKDSMEREWQCGTIQVDFFQPQRFELEYVDSDQSRKTPVILHRVVYGSIERFLGIILEHFHGHLPFWLAPIQARILTITDAQKDYAEKLLTTLAAAGIRAEVDYSGDQISGQIRKAQTDKIPWMLVIGKKEVEHNTITLRHNDGKQEFGLSWQAIVEKAQKLLEE